MQLAAWTTGSDSIGWSSLPHDSRWCITPPPFGQQCTLLRPVAMAACLAMPRCVALTCPDPAESQIGRKVGVTGPICQARSVRTANEKRHGMCRPGGAYPNPNPNLNPNPNPNPNQDAQQHLRVSRRLLSARRRTALRLRAALRLGRCRRDVGEM